VVRTHEPERFIGGAVPKVNGRMPFQWDVVRGYRVSEQKLNDGRVRLVLRR
jgi:hypothetical protein